MKIEKISSKENIEYNLYNLNLEKKDIKKIFLACHGFDSSKDSSSIQQIAEFLSEANIPVISFNWPGHGKNSEKLTLKNCIKFYNIIEKEILREYPNSQIILYGSSFGAYMLLLLYCKHFIDNSNNKYLYCFLKSPAIKMDEIFKEKLIKDDFEKYKSKGYTIKDRNKKMIIPYEFYEDLCDNKIDVNSIKKSNLNIVIFHGTEDDTAPIKDAELLEGKNVKLIKFDRAQHSFKGEYLRRMIQIMLEMIQKS